MKQFWLILAVFLGLAATSVPALADLQFTLNCQSVACSPSGNYGTVTLHQTSGTVIRVTVSLPTTGEKFNNSSNAYALSWNIAGQNVTSVGNITSPHSSSFQIQSFANNQKYRASPFTGNGSCNSAGASCFGYAIDYTGSGSDTSLVFDVTRSTGLALGDFAANGNNFRFAADIVFVNNQGNQAFVVASMGDGVTVPEPGTWTMSIAGLAGLTGLMMLRRRRKLVRAS